jgi:hypothetical protein
LEEVAQICDRQNLRVIAQSFDSDESYHRYHVDITQHAREIMAGLEQISAELSDWERQDEDEIRQEMMIGAAYHGIEARRQVDISVSAPFRDDCGSPCINRAYGRQTMITNFHEHNHERR